MRSKPALAELSESARLFAGLIGTALEAERTLRPYVGELAPDPMLARSWGGTWHEIPHPSRIVQERSEVGDRVGEIYRRMLGADTNLAGLWNKRENAVLSLPREIRAADSSPRSLEVAAFVRQALATVPLRMMAIKHYLSAIPSGVALTEVMWEKLPRGPLQGAWVPVDLIDRPMWRFGWSAESRALHVVGRLNLTPIPVPPMKFLQLTYGTKDTPWGDPLLDKLYWPWYLKKHASKYWALFVERFAQPLVRGTYRHKPGQEAANAAQQLQLLHILDTLRTGRSIALPEGLDVAFLEASRGGDASYSVFLGWLDRAEALLLLGEVDTSGLAKGPGSYAKSQVSNEVRLETVAHDAHLLGSWETDTLLRWIVLLNYGPDAPLPRSVYDATDAADRTERKTGIANTLAEGLPVPKSYFLMTNQVPRALEGEDVVVRTTASPHPPAPQPARAVAPLSRRPGGGGRGVGGEGFSYLVWWTQNDADVRHRPEHNHAVMHGKVFAVDHPIWQTWWPPAGYGCRCFLGTLTAEEARRLGYTGPEPTGPWPLAPGTGTPALPDPGFRTAEERRQRALDESEPSQSSVPVRPCPSSAHSQETP
jgi:phage gp29-like protein